MIAMAIEGPVLRNQVAVVDYKQSSLSGGIRAPGTMVNAIESLARFWSQLDKCALLAAMATRVRRYLQVFKMSTYVAKDASAFDEM